jgi:hypothetical protein
MSRCSVHSDCMGCGIEPRKIDIAGAESLYSLEGNMCSTATRGADALPGSKATSRALLRARHPRPRCRTAKKGNEVAPSHESVG